MPYPEKWVPLGELAEGEYLNSLLPSPLWGRGTEGEGAETALVLNATLSRVAQPLWSLRTLVERFVHKIRGAAQISRKRFSEFDPYAGGKHQRILQCGSVRLALIVTQKCFSHKLRARTAEKRGIG